MAKTIVTAVRLDPQTHEHLKKLAQDQRRPLLQLVRIILEDYAKANRPKMRITA